VNTPDLAPKDGDFVAYLEQLERHQLRSSPSAAHAAASAGMNKTLSTLGGSGASPAALTASAATVRSVPIGIIAIGLVLVIAGATFDGGIFLIALGVFLLWQAARTMVRSARAAAEANKSQAVQQLGTLLAAHAQGKKPPAK